MYFYSINCTQVVKIPSPFVSRIFSFSQSDTVTIKHSPPSIPGYPILFGICLIWIYRTGGIIEHFSFCVGLFSLHIMTWRFIHIRACVTVILFLKVESYSIVFILHCAYPFICWMLVLLPSFGYCEWCFYEYGIQISVPVLGFKYFGCIPWTEIDGFYVNCVCFWGAPYCFLQLWLYFIIWHMLLYAFIWQSNASYGWIYLILLIH